MSNDNQSWIWVGGAILGLLVVGVVFKQWNSSATEESLREEAVRAVEVASLKERGGWATEEEEAGLEAGGIASAKGARQDGRATGDERAGDTGSRGGKALSVRDELKRRSQQAVAAAGGKGGIKADSMLPGAGGVGGGGNDLFREARARVASRSKSGAPLTGPAADKVADAVEDPTGGEPSETPALSILGKDEQARDDDAVANASTATYQAGEGHVFDTNSEVRIPNAGNITGDSGSISFELKPQWNSETGETSDAAIFDLRTPNQWNNRMELVKNGPYLRFLMWDDEGNENGVSYQIKNWAEGEPHPVAVTWGLNSSGQYVMSMYVDGTKVGEKPYPKPFVVPTNQPLVIGNNAGGGLGAKSVLSDFQTFTKRLYD